MARMMHSAGISADASQGSMPTVTIDGEIHDAAPGERLIDLFEGSGVDIPHVCHHPEASPRTSRAMPT